MYKLGIQKLRFEPGNLQVPDKPQIKSILTIQTSS